MSAKVVSVEPRLFTVPLREVLMDAKHPDHSHFALVTVTVRLEDGSEGTGYTYTGGLGGRAIKAMIEHDLAPALGGRDGSAVEELHDFMEWQIHYVGRGGIASFAMSAIDIAFWDIRCKRAGEPLWKMAGGAGKVCKAYCGGIGLQFPLAKLLDSIRGHLAAGFNGVKIKVGQEGLDEDVERVRAVRELIGPELTFMVDANYSMSVDKAIEAAKRFREFDILWFEEPTLPDDYRGDARIADFDRGFRHVGKNLKCIGIDLPGGMQSSWTVPAYTLHRLPADLALAHGAMIEPAAVACHDVRLGEVKAGEVCVVIGGGPIGLLIALVAGERAPR